MGKPLFIFEMANNHCGSVEHGLRIIRETKRATEGLDFEFAFKFQYRDLDTFIHPDFRGRTDLPYVKRFSESRLSRDELRTLREELRALGFVAVCTPFDERSVDLIEEHGFDVIKIASCSFTDWPLLERIAAASQPVIASTAGATLEEIDNVATFWIHRNRDLTLMHCVGEYPTPRERLQLNQIELLRRRYPDVRVGFSTHEDPDDTDAVRLAVAKGATVFERHVSAEAEGFPINAYSSRPPQVRRWLEAARDAYAMLGVDDGRHESTEKEQADLDRFRRGVFARADLRRGDRVTRANAFFAFPCAEGQLLANDLSKYREYALREDVKAGGAIAAGALDVRNTREKVLEIVRDLREILLKSHVALPNRMELELSHHYGIERYHEHGAAILTCVNREYCKKLIVVLPGQDHPVHRHVKKEETFQVLYGELRIDLDGQERTLKPGDLVTVEREAKHGFRSETGCIFEEISTTHFKDDSLYEDGAVARNTERKTQMTFWSDWLQKEVR